MQKKVLSFILISMFLFLAVLGSYMIPKVFATLEILYVPAQYSTIQAALDAANPGDTIQVASRIYHEHVILNKSVSLIGENPLNTIIDGSGTGNNTVTVTKYANNVKIEGFTIQNSDNPFEPTSLSIADSRGYTISNNIIKQSNYGLRISSSNDSYIVNNVIVNNTVAGIYLSSSNRNNVIGNLLEKNSIGIKIADMASRNNTFYHNNFVNNIGQVSMVFASTTKWDNGAEGNYWSDYHGQDLNGDGIGDTGTPHLAIDRYPLIEEWRKTRDFFQKWKEVTYHTVVSSNSTVASFNFNYSLAQISFNVTGPRDAVSFCNVTIDKSFLDGIFTVLVDKIQRNCFSTSNSTHTSLYFTFSHSTRIIQIRGTKVVGNLIPTADFAYSPTEPKEGQDTQFTDTSTDPNGTVVAWSWNFGDGDTSSLRNPIHRYMKGTYIVTLTVTDNEGAMNSVAKTMVVSLLPPDYTLYYILIGIAAGAFILITTLFLLKRKKKGVRASVRQKRSGSKIQKPKTYFMVRLGQNRLLL